MGSILLRIFLCILHSWTQGEDQELSADQEVHRQWTMTKDATAQSCPAHLQLWESWRWSWGLLHLSGQCHRLRMGQDTSPGRRIWAGKGRGVTSSQTCFHFYSSSGVWTCAIQQESNGTWYPHLDTSLFLGQITNTFSNQHIKNMTALYAQMLHVLQNPVKTPWLKYNTQIFRLLHKFKHIQWIKQGIQRQLEIPRGISKYIKAQLLAIYSFQLLCSGFIAHVGAARFLTVLMNQVNSSRVEENP